VRKRYLAVRVIGEQPSSGKAILRAVWNAVLQLFGEYGASQTGLTLIEHNLEGRYTILRCFHRAVDMVRASIASITEIDGKPVALYVFRVSGTLRSIRRVCKEIKSD